MAAPTDKKELERFLGLVNYVGKFLPNLSDITSHLRVLLKKEFRLCMAPWTWCGL